MFLGAAADAERPGVWVALGATFLAAGASYAVWRRPAAKLRGESPPAAVAGSGG
jgi:hypothetical protein